jgi:hypothetical protein
MKKPLLLALAALVAGAAIAAAWWPSPPQQPRILALAPAPGTPYTRPCNNNPAVPWSYVVLVPGATFPGMDGVVPGDFDEDGDPDFLVSAEQSDSFFFAVNPGPSSIGAGGLATVVLSSTLNAAEGNCTGDLDDDGHLDAVGVGQDENSAIWCANPLPGGDPLDPGDWVCNDLTNALGLDKNFMTCVTGDYDGDGDDDLLIGSTSGAAPGAIAYMPSPSFSYTEVVVTGRTMTLANLVGSSPLSVMASDRQAEVGGTPGVFRLAGNGDGTFVRHNIASGTGSVRMMFSLGDVDGDGDEWDLCTGVDSAPWSGLCYLYVGANRWTPRWLPPPGDFGQFQWSAFADINSDGYPDMFVTADASSSGGDALMWLEGPFFTWMPGFRHEIDDVGIKGDNCAIGDWHGADGDPDAVCTEQNVGGVGVGRGLVLHINPCF